MPEKFERVFFQNQQNNLDFEIQKLNLLNSSCEFPGLDIPHRVNFYVILFITRGFGHHVIDFMKYQYKVGSLLLIAKGQVHAFQLNFEAEGYLIFFTDNFLNENQIKFNDLSYSYPFNTYLHSPLVEISNDQNRFKLLFSYIYEEFISKENMYKEEILQCLLRTLLLKLRKYMRSYISVDSGNKASTQLFIQFHQLLKGERSRHRNANELCNQLNVSYRKLNEICKRLTCKTLKQFIDDTLILQAKSYMVDGEYNISEIANLTGFKEVTNFTKFFKKHTGETPKVFARSL